MLRAFLAVILLGIAGTAWAGVKGDAHKNCKMEYPGQPRHIQRCYNIEISSRKQLREFARNGWGKQVRACYYENPGLARGRDQLETLRCFSWERQRILKERRDKRRRR